MDTNTQTHAKYLREYVSKSIMSEMTVLNERDGGVSTRIYFQYIMLELTVLNERCGREGGESYPMERGHTKCYNKWK